MSTPKTVELALLTAAEDELSRWAKVFSKFSAYEARLQILEACASRLGGFSLKDYYNAFCVKPCVAVSELEDAAKSIVACIQTTGIHPALALSALSREPLKASERRNKGVYNTDFRLASRLSELAAPSLSYKSVVIDPACGSGILLVALSIAVCGDNRRELAHWLTNGVYAADQSVSALRGTLLSLASLTDNVASLVKMRAKWLCGDSLLAEDKTWQMIAPSGFDAVIANPPWEKVKLSLHEFVKSAGHERHYGAEHGEFESSRFSSKKEEVTTYSRQLISRYPDLKNGEPDLYVAFTELFIRLCRPGGLVAALLPGGLIRSQGTTAIRKRIFEQSKSVSLSIIDNRMRFFEIDTRFKFLALAFQKSQSPKASSCRISLLHERGTDSGTIQTGSVSISLPQVRKYRADLSIPEVRNNREWELFKKIQDTGRRSDDSRSEWKPVYCREVDMTKERPRFQRRPGTGLLPVVEGRMVQHFRFGAKSYSSGSGRAAVWNTNGIGASELKPQFWISPQYVPKSNVGRTSQLRAGFCDIAGQTNERSLMAALIPPGVVCGNKVPTIVFPDDPSEDRLYVWIAIANSIPIDWQLRRVITTTVNYFMLDSLAMPQIARSSLPWARLEVASRRLHQLDTAGSTMEIKRSIAAIRAGIDAEIAVAFELDVKDLLLILDDFPNVDRRQHPIRGESRSTITRDLLIATLCRRLRIDDREWQERVAEAYAEGAEAYIPSEMADELDDSPTRKLRAVND